MTTRVHEFALNGITAKGTQISLDVTFNGDSADRGVLDALLSFVRGERGSMLHLPILPTDIGGRQHDPHDNGMIGVYFDIRRAHYSSYWK